MSFAASLRRHRRLLLLPIVLAAVFLWLRSTRSRPEAELHLRLGAAAPTVRQLDLRFRRAGSDGVAYERTRRFGDAAPADLYEKVPLPPGDYELGARVTTAAGPARNLTRAFHVGDRPAEIDLGP